MPDQGTPPPGININESMSPAFAAAYNSPDGANIAKPDGTFYNVKSSSQAVTTSTPANTYVNNLGNGIASAAAQPPITPTVSNPSGNPASVNPTPYIQLDGSYGPSPDPYGFGTPGYNQNNDPRNTTAAADANKIYTDRQTQLQQQRDAEIASLQAKEQVDKSNLQQTQVNETGTSNRNLAYLQEGGQSASAQAYLNSLDISHQKEMDNLTAQYNSAIQTAQNAFNDKDFALAESMTTNAKNIKDDALKRNQSFLDYSLKLTTEANNTARTNYQIQQDQVKNNQTNLAFARDNGLHPGAQFFSVGGAIFNSADGSPAGSTKEQLIANGVSPDLSNVQMIEKNPNKQYAGGALGEFQYLVDQGVYQPDQFQKYMDKKKSDAVAIAAAGRAPTQAQTDAEAWSSFTCGDLGANGNPSLNGITLKQLLGAKAQTKSADGTILVGPDGLLNPEVVKQMRDYVGLQNPKNLTKFDSLVSPHLSNYARGLVGIGKYNNYVGSNYGAQ